MISKLKDKLKNWIRRYLPAEILGTLFAVLLPSAFALVATDNKILIAFVGAWGENIGFYGTMIVQEILESLKKCRATNKKYNYIAFAKDIRNIFLEFGAAETADSLFVRPATMYFGMGLFGNLQLGVLVGKIMADFIFYIPTVISYELRKKHLG